MGDAAMGIPERFSEGTLAPRRLCDGLVLCLQAKIYLIPAMRYLCVVTDLPASVGRGGWSAAGDMAVALRRW